MKKDFEKWFVEKFGSFGMFTSTFVDNMRQAWDAGYDEGFSEGLDAPRTIEED